MVGVHGISRCYPSAEPAPAKPVSELDPLGLDAAFEASFSAKRSKPTKAPDDLDPLGLDAAFDLIGGGAADGEGDLSDESLADDLAESDVSDEAQGIAPNASDSDNITDDDAEEDTEAPGADERHLRRLRGLDAFERVGKLVKFNGQVLGQITGWNGNVSCVCKFHRACRIPASRNWQSDTALEDWLLAAVAMSGGEPRLDKTAHVQRITAIAARTRLGR